MIRIRPDFAALVILAALSSLQVLAQSNKIREHVGTSVTATPETIVLDWDPKHPWATDLSRGATLVAEYNTHSQGVVLQKLAVGKVAGTSVQSMRFVLPAELTVPPAGPVCLFIEVANNRMLPVRKGGGGHADTARFRDQPWESQAAARSGDTATRSTLAAYENAAHDADHQVELERAELARRGVIDRTGCPSINVPSFAAERPFDVISQDEVPDASRRACITRVLRSFNQMVDDFNKAKPDERPETMASYLLRSVMPPDLTIGLIKSVNLPVDVPRAHQLTEFQRDWMRFSKNPDVEPHLLLGDESDSIALQSLTTKTSGAKIVLIALFVQLHKPVPPDELKKIDPADVAGFVGGELEAYSRCIVDSQHQLQNKLDEWKENQRKAPELRESARKQLVAACQQTFTRMDSLLAQQKSAHDRLDAARAGAHATTADGGPGAASVPLNDVTCSPR